MQIPDMRIRAALEKEMGGGKAAGYSLDIPPAPAK
jgi:hypothetical protein